MKTFEFKSQICTTREQSERLLALGLKKETADMCWQKTAFDGKVITYPSQDVWHCSTAIMDSHFPAWSLHRLLMITTSKRKVLLIRYGSDLFDVVIRRIEREIKKGDFNKNYLEETL